MGEESNNLTVSAHPKSVYSSRDIVPGDRQWNQGAPQLGVDAVPKDMLVSVIIREGDAAKKKKIARN